MTACDLEVVYYS